MTDIVVSKFGGSSITKPEDIERIREITSETYNGTPKRVVVVSAPGKRLQDDVKVTDMLIELAENKDLSLKDRILDRYYELSDGADIGGIAQILEERLEQGLDDEKALASIKAFGEEACARLISGRLNAVYVDPRRMLEVSSDFSNAKISSRSKKRIMSVLGSTKGLLVIPGFYGYTKNNEIATFSRGGSDLTGSFIAASLDARLYENFTDTDGVLAADPHIVKNPRTISEMTYDEIGDLAYSGFKVLHEEAMFPVRDAGIPIHIRNTFRYPEEGTFIVSDRSSDPNKPIVGVAYKPGLCSFDVASFGFNNILGIGNRILGVFSDKGISIEYITTGTNDMSVILHKEQLKNHGKIDYLKKKLLQLVGENALVDFKEHIGSVVVAGKGLKTEPKIDSKVQDALTTADVEIVFSSKGPLKRCIIYGVNDRDSSAAVNAIYKRFLN